MPEDHPPLHAVRAKCLAAGACCEELVSLGKGLRRGGREVLGACARICALAAGELSPDSTFRRHVCAPCAVFCRACVDECRAQNGELFARCAEACEAAARACRATALEA